ncbi:1-acyl-sn-glycerol-3-phosphate acyltransferase delta-like [Actinia tenebrosa]|uniref:1-acyl-sn-glycerol-3-phosphate acyltransferase delta-like n=1 Tax=Actinia tenebrosa TaxID=6105 RepID=A0A6P8HNY7_ACTTE|nr:1-acyl-sn-glycerol-3-phosphate acyltransferase delta-like [Actinia tenebrosa]XP_031554342.1 1-acyl-sn-glycerol-3-phosphate acyltransferase delta-like [Actinia tenebrosa]
MDVLDQILYVLKMLPGAWLWFVLVFLVSGLIINIIQLSLLPLWFINKTLYRWLNLRIVYLHWCQLTFLAEWWGGVNIKLYGNKEDYDKLGSESGICLANHRSDVDWLIGWIMADRAGILGGTKCFMKGYLKFLPILGISWWSTEYAFVSRNWKHDKTVLERSLQTLEDFPYPFWIAIFAEGTRITDEKLEASIEYAKNSGLPILHHHLLPRPRGFAITAHHLKDKLPVVYDMEMGFPPGSEPTMRKLLLGEGFEVHLLIRRIPVSAIPTGSIEETSDWCRQLYQEKDKALGHFLEHKEFPAPRVIYPRKLHNIFVVLAWHLLLLFPLVSYIISVLLSGNIKMLFIAFGVVILGYLMVKVLLHVSDSKKGSSFGLKSTSNNVIKKKA